MSEFIVRSDIPLPEKRAAAPRNYPFSTMKVGQSFDIPYSDDVEYLRRRINLTQAISKFQRSTKNTIKFTARNSKAEKLIRVWRFQ